MKKVLVVGVLAVVLIAFQNCAKTSFSNAKGDSLDSKGSLAPMPLEPADVAADGSASGQISQSSEMPGKKPPKDSDSDSTSNDDSRSDDLDLVACILDDNGKSLKLGFVADKLEGVNAVSQSVCLSRHACLDLVSKVFKVQGPYERGYCEHNPNVLRLKDADVEALVKKMMP